MTRDVAVERVCPRFGVQGAVPARAGSEVDLLEAGVLEHHQIVLEGPFVRVLDGYSAGRGGELLRLVEEVAGLDVDRAPGSRSTATPAACRGRARRAGGRATTPAVSRRRSRRAHGDLGLHSGLSVPGDVAEQ